MDILLLLLTPLVLLWLGVSELIGRPGGAFTPQRALSHLWRAARYLWRERAPRAGAARAQRPPLRYGPPRGGGR